MSKLTKSKIELTWWKTMLLAFFYLSTDLLIHHSYIVGILSGLFGMVVLEAVIESANRIQSIQRNRFNGY